MEIRKEARALLDSARARLAAIRSEAGSLETLVAALELASENGNLEGVGVGVGVEDASSIEGESEGSNGGVKESSPRRRSPMRAKAARGEMRAALLEAFGHYDGRGVAALALSKYVAKHKPDSLKRAGLDLREIHKRVTNELFRMKVAGEVEGTGSRMDRIWSMRVKAGRRRKG